MEDAKREHRVALLEELGKKWDLSNWLLTVCTVRILVWARSI